MSNLLTKEEAMKKFGIDDLRKFNTKDFIQIMSSFDKMDPTVVKELIGKIPNFLDYAKESAIVVKDTYKDTLKSDDDSLNKIYASYDLLIDSLNKDLQDEELSLDQKFEIAKLIRDVIHNKEELHFKQQEKRHELYKQIAGGVLAAAVCVIGVLSGASLTKGSSDSPTHDDDYS